MHIFGISDIHMDYKKEKPMEIFGENWKDHEKKIFLIWEEKIGEDDIVLIPGDISWATSLEDAYNDLLKIEMLPGRKVISKGNHDYWWSSMTKLNNLGFKSIVFLHNNSFVYDNFEIFGTRGWSIDEENNTKKNNQKIYDREILRLNNSLRNIKKTESTKIALIHFPPFNKDMELNDFGKKIVEKNIDYCLYGHIHGEEAHKNIIDKIIRNTTFICVSADFLKFQIKKII